MPLPRLALITTLLCLLGAAGGVLASFLPVPLPWLLGSLVFSAVLAIRWPELIPAEYDFPQAFRMVFVSLIGVLIGAQVTPGFLASVPRMAASLAAVAAFAILAQAVNYLIFRRLGGYDRATAYFAGAPGGLIESLTFGEASGADPVLLITQQFLRIILVIVALPLALSLWHGHPVGSAAGQGMGPGAVPLSELPLIGLATLLGIALGRVLRLPAWQLTGALALAAAMSLAGWPLRLPAWLVGMAQVVIGAALGMRFVGMNRAILVRGIGLTLVSVVSMLLIGAALAALILPFAGQPFEVLLIAFAPGGINEMALVALSLQANPAFVTLHHIMRLTVTVLGMGVFSRRLARRDKTL